MIIKVTNSAVMGFIMNSYHTVSFYISNWHINPGMEAISRGARDIDLIVGGYMHKCISRDFISRIAYFYNDELNYGII